LNHQTKTIAMKKFNNPVSPFLMMVFPVVLLFMVSTTVVKNNKIEDNALSTTTITSKATDQMVSLGEKTLVHFLLKK
jgi:hypothetical protein